MKKLMAVAAAILTAAVIFSGCSTDEVNFYKTVKSLDSLKSYTYSATTKIDVNRLDVGSGLGNTQSVSLVKSLLNGATINYTGGVDASKNRMTLNANLVTGDGEVKSNIGFVLDNSGKDSLLYVSPIISASIPSQFGHDEVKLNGMEYYKYDLNTVINEINAMSLSQEQVNNPYDPDTQASVYKAYNDGFDAGYKDGYAMKQDGSDGYSGDKTAYEDGYMEGVANFYEDMSVKPYKQMVPALEELTMLTKKGTVLEDMQNKLSTFADQFINDYSSGLTLGLVERTGTDAYSFNVTTKSALSTLDKLLSYFGENPVKLKSMMVSFASGLTDQEVGMLGIDGVTTKDELVKRINSISITDSDMQLIMATLDGQFKTLAAGIGMNLQYSIQKTGSTAYRVSSTVDINNNNDITGGLGLDIDVRTTENIKG